MGSRLLVLAVLCAVILPACGGGGGGGDGADAAGTERAAPQDATPRGPLDLPRGVPPRPSGGAVDPAQVTVIRGWSEALRSGDVAAASAFWAVPSKVQNGTPVIVLRTRDAVRLFNSSLTCGSLVTKTAAAQRGFTIVTVRLTERPGGDCATGAGSSARTAIRVRNDKIVEWYRLPDDPAGPGPDPGPPSGGSDETTV